MRPRPEIVEIFASFLQFSSDDLTKWITDTVLDKNIRIYLQKPPSPEPSSSDWALYWHKLWRSQKKSGQDFGLTRRHLYAFLQEVTYRAAAKVKPGYTKTLPQYTLEDFFQIAIANTDKVLIGFDPVRHPNLESYAYHKLVNLIKDQLVQEGVEAANFRSDWSLLKDSSEKRIEESLKQRGLNITDIERYVLAWECFKEIYIPNKPRGNSQLAAPDSITWDAIAQLYNQEQLSQLSQSTPVDSSTIQKWMKVCIEAIRAYLAPPTASLDEFVFNDDNTLQDILPSSDVTPLAQLLEDEEAQNRQALHQQVKAVLSNTITNADTQTQELLQIKYREGLNQTEIAARLNISQPTVNRRLNQFKTKSLEALLTSLNISLTPDVIKNMNKLIDEWLEQYYGNDNEV